MRTRVRRSSSTAPFREAVGHYPSLLSSRMAERSRVSVLVLGAGLALAACGVPNKYVADRDHFNQALTAFGQAVEVSQAGAGAGPVVMTAALRDTLVKLLRHGLASADSVSDPFLTWLHPQMPTQFREFLVAGERLTLESILAEDFSRQARAQQLLAQWEQFFRPLSVELAA